MNRFSRRTLLKTTGVASAAPLLASSGAIDDTTPVTAPGPEDLVHLKSGDLTVAFDKRDGTIYSLQSERDALHTNFVGNASNTRGIRLRDTLWTGHVVSTIWATQPRDSQPAPGRTARGWRRQTTVESSDIRKVSFDGTNFTVRYEGRSKNAGGIDSYDLKLTYRPAEGNSLLLDVEVQNTTGGQLEAGEFALPLRANDDYVEAYGGMSLRQAIETGKLGEIQTAIYEQKVLAHHFAGGYSSYALLERPRGNPPFLLVQAIDAPIECVYKVEGFRPWHDDWIGTDLLGLHTWAVPQQRRWADPWVNGHTSLLLAPGETKSWRFRFALLNSYQELAPALFESGALAIRVTPSMVVQENTDVQVEIRSKLPVDKVEQHADGIEIKSQRRDGDRTFLTLAFKRRGQKTVKLLYGAGKWTNLHFYCLEPYEQLIKARGRFVIEREFYEHPDDPFNRNHVFLPFDTRRGLRLEDMDDVSEVGGAGDAGFSAPLFLSEKNVYFPSREEIDVLETYVADCLFKHIQNPQTYEVRSSLYWKEPHYPSMGPGRSTKERSESTARAYNYIFAGNIYYALYRIGKEYGLLRKRTPDQYLDMAYRTYVKGYDTGPYRHMGLITGSNALRVLADLKEEGWNRQYDELLAKIKECDAEFVRDPYPYGSEIPIDHTGQEQVYFFTRHFGNEEKRKKTVDTLRALKGAMQPVWFRYGVDLFAHPDLRSEICCWHSSAMNAMVLMQEFEATGDIDLLRRAYPGHVSVMTEVTGEGAGYGWFMCTPGVYAHEPPRTFENGPALWAFLRGVKAWVVNDDAFGLTGLGCRVESSANAVTVSPQDGVRKRLRFVTEKIDLNASSGELEKVVLRRDGSSLQLQMGDSTGLVKTAKLAIHGLKPGEYELQHPGKRERVTVGEVMNIQVPMSAARQITIRRI